MLRQRLLTSLVLVPVLLGAAAIGKPWFTVLVGVGAFLGLYEFYKLADKGGWRPFAACGALCTFLLLFYMNRSNTDTSVLLGGVFLLSLAWLVLRTLYFGSDIERAFPNWIWTVGGVLYLGFLLGFWILLRNSFGWEWTYVAMLSTFAVDTSAFLVGRSWGKNPLAPRISPKKTTEGALGGIIGGTAATVVLAGIFGLIGSASPFESEGVPLEFGAVLFLGVLISISAQIGDLAESMLKRSAGAKDAGTLFPGHGGMLDRVDSLVFTGVVVYSYITWLR